MKLTNIFLAENKRRKVDENASLFGAVRSDGTVWRERERRHGRYVDGSNNRLEECLERT